MCNSFDESAPAWSLNFVALFVCHRFLTSGLIGDFALKAGCRARMRVMFAIHLMCTPNLLSRARVCQESGRAESCLGERLCDAGA